DQDGSIGSVSDLAGKTVYASGKGSTPEYALNYILEKNGLTPGSDVFVEWKSEHAECVAAMAENPQAIALLPQPFVTTAQMKNESIRPALDLTEEWDAVQTGDEKSSLITGVAIARADFVEHPEAVKDFLQRYEASVDFGTRTPKRRPSWWAPTTSFRPAQRPFPPQHRLYRRHRHERAACGISGRALRAEPQPSAARCRATASTTTPRLKRAWRIGRTHGRCALPDKLDRRIPHEERPPDDTAPSIRLKRLLRLLWPVAFWLAIWHVASVAIGTISCWYRRSTRSRAWESLQAKPISGHRSRNRSRASPWAF
ncbi:MAG: ABC transporter substrate-binding protein, partial [Eggerthellaceae bacterium]